MNFGKRSRPDIYASLLNFCVKGGTILLLSRLVIAKCGGGMIVWD